MSIKSFFFMSIKSFFFLSFFLFTSCGANAENYVSTTKKASRGNPVTGRSNPSSLTTENLFTSPGANATYYVSTTGKASWGTEAAQCGHPTTGRSNPCALWQANSYASAGDLVILLNGVYTDSLGIWPSNSGTSDSPITFQAESESAILRTTNYGVTIGGTWKGCKNYIIINGFTIDNANGSKWVVVGSQDGNESIGFEMANCKLVSNHYYGWAGLLLQGNVSDVYIHDNLFQSGIGNQPGVADLIYITTTDADDVIQRILIEDNEIYGGSHNAVMVAAANSGTIRKLVFRGNTISNPNHTGIGFALDGEDILIENNIIFDCGSICGDDGDLSSCEENTYGTLRDKASNRTWHGGISLLEWNHAIIRNNIISNAGYGLGMDVPNSRNHRVYNNVFHNNTRGLELNVGSPGSYDNHFVNNLWYNNTLESPAKDYEMRVVSLDPVHYRNYVRNNIIYSDFLIQLSTTDSGQWLEPVENLNEISAEWTDNTSDITWISLSKQHAIFDSAGKGAPLTTAIGSGSESTKLVVEDSMYFYDAWEIGGLSGDQILIDDVIANISSINYETNTITLSSAKSWPDKAEIRLFQNAENHIGLYYQRPMDGLPGLP